MKLRTNNAAIAYAISVCTTGLAFGARWVLEPYIGQMAPYMLFILAALLTAVLGGWGPGLLAVVAGQLLGHYYFAPEGHQLLPQNPSTWIHWGLYDCVTVLGLCIVETLHRVSAKSAETLRRAQGQEEQLRTIIREISAAQERVQELASIVESADDAIISMTLDGTVRSWNKGAEHLLGFSAAQMIDQPIERIIPHDRLSESKALMARVVAGELVPPLETTRLTREGKILDVSVRLSPFRDGTGKVAGVSAIVRDISDLKRTHAALLETEQRFRTMADNAPLMIWLTDDEKQTAWVNRTWRLFTGRVNELESVEGWSEPVHPEDRPAWRQAMAEATSKKQSFETEYRLRRADGEWRWVLERGTPRYGSDGQLLGCIGSCMDVTEWKQAEEAVENKFGELRQAQQALRSQNEELAQHRRDLEVERARYRELFDSAPIGYIITSRQGVIQQVNRVAAEMLGESAKFLEGFPFARLLAKQDRTAFFANIGKLTRNEITQVAGWEATVSPQTKTPFACSIVVNLLHDETGRVMGLRWILRDITERKEAEHRIMRLNAELEQRVKERTAALEEANRELESFSYSVSHDLRAPLRSINGFSRAVLEEYGDKLDEQGVKYLRYAQMASVRMGQLIEDLLELSRVSRGELQCQDLNLSELAESVIAELRNSQPGHRIETVVQPGMWVSADSGLLRIALENLFSNAWKFTARTHSPRMEVGFSIQDSKPCVFVRDNGAGFDIKSRDRLFGVFQRLHTQEEFPGTGIGLATVKRIFARHGGTVWAEGQINEGATFFFSLPRMMCSTEPPEEPGRVALPGSSPAREAHLVRAG